MGNFPAICIATKLRDKLQKRLPSVTAPLAVNGVLRQELVGIKWRKKDSNASVTNFIIKRRYEMWITKTF